MSERVLITGSREWADEAAIEAVIAALPADAIVIHGAALGADSIADRLARARGLCVYGWPAEWVKYGKEAGPIRNQRMLEEGNPTSAHAFPLPQSVGTWDMVRRLRAAKVPFKIHGSAELIDAYVSADSRIARLCAFDFETHRFGPGRMAPPPVCASSAELVDGRARGRLHATPASAEAQLRRYLVEGWTVAFANAAYDLAVAAARYPHLLPLIFQALAEGRIYDVLIGQSLDAIWGGHLGLDPSGVELRSPSTGVVTNRYNLEIVTWLTLGRADAKANDVFRESYALLEGFPPELWPPEAAQYPQDDAANTLESALAQIAGRAGEHEWRSVLKAPPEVGSSVLCKWCSAAIGESGSMCWAAPRRAPHRNASNHAFQVESALALHLGACHGLRTDPARVAKLSAEVEKKHASAVERFQKKGWIREDGSESQAAVKKAIAEAYGAKSPCPRCFGTGKVPKIVVEDCRGVKERGRYRGCLGYLCLVCRGEGKLKKQKGENFCKNIFDGDVLVEAGCDGTGYDLSAVPMLPRAEKFGVKTDRDTKMESGDEDLADYGEDEHEKSRSTYIPYLKDGIVAPLFIKSNSLVASGRCSYESCPVHQFPREGGERECIRARGEWCGYPTEMVLGSTDYSAGELCTLSQYTYWLFGYSRMLEAINRSGDPGILHSELASEVLGLSTEDFLKRQKEKDKQALTCRQTVKCFHPDTEILTRLRGWVKISDLSANDEVASVEPSEGARPEGEHSRAWWRKERKNLSMPKIEIVWSKPTRLTRRRAVEGLLHFQNKSIDLRVTPDHRMLVFGGTNKAYTVEARDFGKQRGWFSAGMCSSGDLVIDERLLRLAVAAQADGTYLVDGKPAKKVKFGFSKKRKIDRLSNLLFPGEFERTVSSNGDYQPTTWFTLNEELSFKIKDLLDSDKTLPWWWLQFTPKLRAVIVEEASFWDSHRNHRHYVFSSTIRKNSDVLQAVASITDRKAAYVGRTTVPRPNEQFVNALSVKDRNYTRGENVKVSKLDYDGDVVCLSVPSSYVLVRDGGIPVVVGQCINFGKPAAMGSAKITLTNRKKNAGFTVCENGPAHNRKGEPGYWGIRFCISIGGAKSCGIEKLLEWKTRPTPPVCRACVEAVEHVLTPAYFRRFPEIKDYHKWGAKMVEDKRRAPSLVWDADAGRPKVVRERGGCDLSAFLNNGFQSMLADIGKGAYSEATRECYLGVKSDGSPSPLAGCRLPLFMHDEPVSELTLKTAHLSGPRIAEIMVSHGRQCAPDVKAWKAETALGFYLSKSLEPSYVCSKCSNKIKDGDNTCYNCGVLSSSYSDAIPSKKLVPWEAAT